MYDMNMLDNQSDSNNNNKDKESKEELCLDSKETRTTEVSSSTASATEGLGAVTSLLQGCVQGMQSAFGSTVSRMTESLKQTQQMMLTMNQVMESCMVQSLQMEIQSVQVVVGVDDEAGPQAVSNANIQNTSSEDSDVILRIVVNLKNMSRLPVMQANCQLLMTERLLDGKNADLLGCRPEEALKEVGHSSDLKTPETKEARPISSFSLLGHTNCSKVFEVNWSSAVKQWDGTLTITFPSPGTGQALCARHTFGISYAQQMKVVFEKWSDCPVDSLHDVYVDGKEERRLNDRSKLTVEALAHKVRSVLLRLPPVEAIHFFHEGYYRLTSLTDKAFYFDVLLQPLIEDATKIQIQLRSSCETPTPTQKTFLMEIESLCT